MAIERPLGAGLALLPLALLMAALGWWQIEKLKEKQALIAGFESAESMTLEQAVESGKRFTRIDATGRFDPRRHILLDNMVLDGRPGVHVFTPFQTFSGTSILVNRGWLPMAVDRRSLPEIWTAAVPVNIRGILAPPPEHRQKLGAPTELSANDWPQLVTYLDLDQAADALEISLPDWVVWLAPDDPAGFEGRDWSPAVMTPERHRAYAIQWFALAVTALVIWLALVLRAMRRNTATGDGA